MRLIADGISASRGGEAVFEGIGFDLGEGDALVVTGPNGSGKSTLLRVIAGLLPLLSGRVEMSGSGEAFPTAASACHYLGHLNGMKPPLTVAENLGFWQSFLGSPRLSIEDVLSAVDLGGLGHLPYAILSTGQKRRASIARLLASHRPVWLLDEPTAGLDSASEAGFTALVKGHLTAGGIVVAATHLPLGLEGARTLRMGDL
jgi:heme exporter protein A